MIRAIYSTDSCSSWSLASSADPWLRYPQAFAQLLAADYNQRQEGFRWAQRVWNAVLSIESRSRQLPAMKKLRSKLFFMDMAAVQLKFRILDHFHFKEDAMTPDAWHYFRRSKVRVGDSALIENSNKRARRAEREGQSKEVSTHRILHTIRCKNSNAISDRDIPHVSIPNGCWEQKAEKLSPTWKERTEMSKSKNPRLEAILKASSAGPSVASRAHSVGALYACVALVERGLEAQAGKTWMACTMQAQTLVRVLVCNFFPLRRRVYVGVAGFVQFMSF